MSFVFAYFLTIIIESTVLILLLRRKYAKVLIVRNVVVASSLTLLFVWFVFPMFGLGWIVETTIAELFAFFVEAGIFVALFKKMSWRDALFASLICNAASFLIGLVF